MDAYPCANTHSHLQCDPHTLSILVKASTLVYVWFRKIMANSHMAPTMMSHYGMFVPNTIGVLLMWCTHLGAMCRVVYHISRFLVYIHQVLPCATKIYCIQQCLHMSTITTHISCKSILLCNPIGAVDTNANMDQQVTVESPWLSHWIYAAKN